MSNFKQTFYSVLQLAERVMGGICSRKGTVTACLEVMAMIIETVELDRDDARLQLASAMIAFKERVNANAEEKWAILCSLCKRIHDVALSYNEKSIDDWRCLVGLVKEKEKGLIKAFIVEYVRAVHEYAYSHFEPPLTCETEALLRLVIPHTPKDETQQRFVMFEELGDTQKPFVIKSLAIALSPDDNNFDYVNSRVCEGSHLSMKVSKESFSSLIDAWTRNGIKVTIV